MFSGSIVALITPMDSKGNIDYVSLKRLVDFHADSGTDAIVSVGTTGESSTLTEEEHIEVVIKTVEFCAGRIPVLAGTGSNSTREAIYYSQVFQDTGVAGCLSVVPYYNKPTQEGLYQHFKAIAESSKLPHLLYNVPGRTVADLKPETVARLANIDNIVGIKDATGDLSRVSLHKELCGEDFVLLSGDDPTGLAFMELGGNGVISVTNNVAAKQMSRMIKYALAGDFDEARRIDNQIAPLHQNLFVEANPIPVKWALQQMGLIADASLRLPMTTLDETFQPLVKQALRDAKML